MSREEKQFYFKVGQAVCNIVGAIMFVGVPISACALVGYISSLI